MTGTIFYYYKSAEANNPVLAGVPKYFYIQIISYYKDRP